jgi:putative PIN family toxin of toxin-antitoxin system
MSAERRRFVLDTNVLVSALLFKDSPPGRVLRWVLRNGVLLRSTQTFEELGQVLSRPKFDRYVSAAHRLEFAASIHREAEAVIDSESISACRDPKDDKFLELAVSGAADGIVSGDDDLLVLSPFRGIPILAPALFAQRFP